MIDSFFIHFIMSSLASSVAILLILLVKKGMQKHISARWQYYIDLLFLVLLVVPFIPGGFFTFTSVGNWLNGLALGGAAATNVNTAANEGAPFMYGMGRLQDFSVSVERYTPEYSLAIFAGIWCAGIVVCLVFLLLGNRNLRLIIESMKPVEDAEIIALFMRCKTELGIKDNIQFGASVLIKTPMTVGFFKTRIILPAETLPKEDIRYVLLHELTHCKNRDIPINGIMCLLQILYWFNPLVFLVFKEMRLDREMACDVSVLKLLPEKLHVAYGKTLLNFVNKLSRSATLSFATDMGGSKRQIKKRLESIASFTAESRMLRAKSVCLFALISFLILSQIPAITALAAYDNGGRYCSQSDNAVYEDLASYFDGFEGCFVLYDLEADKYCIYNKDKSLNRVSPVSTYKIYSALIALETGVIDTDRSARLWNGTPYPYEAWNQNQDLMSAMQNSVSWYFQDTDAQVGMKELNSYYTQLSYGNHDLSGGIGDYWMESSLRISPLEQVELLKSFYQNDTIFKPEHVNTLKNILRLSEKDGAILSGKTGTGAVNGKVINGWFVGYVENNGRTFIFATNIQGKDKAGGSAAVQITLSILQDKDIY